MDIAIRGIDSRERFSGIEIALGVVSEKGEAQISRDGIFIGGALASEKFRGIGVGMCVNAKKTRGVVMGGVAGGDDLVGVGIGVISRSNHLRGLNIGITTLSLEKMEGAVIGIINLIGKQERSDYGTAEARGAELALLGNYTNGTATGAFLSGVFNYSSTLDGLAVSGVANYNKGARGVQVSAINYTSENLQGVQIGGINVARDCMRGVQLGLFNGCGEDAAGLQIGAINYRSGAPWYARVVPGFAVRKKRETKAPTPKS